MSDRYETPSWDSEPDDLGTRNPVADDPAELDAGTPEVGTEEQGLDASSENVLDGWPAVDLDAAPEEQPAVEEAPPGDAPEIAEPDRDDLTAAPMPLADHVSDSMEHAPGELTVPPGYSVLEGVPTGERRAVGIVVARFNGDVTTRLLESALAELDARGVPSDSVTVMPVPGAFELPLAAMALAKTRRFACIVALGCVIRGDTPHFDYVSSEAASGLQLAAIETGVPVAFGVLTLDRADQAESRVRQGRRSRPHRPRDGRPVREPARSCGAIALLVADDRPGIDLGILRGPRMGAFGVRYNPQPHVQDLLTLREEARLRKQPKPLDGRHQAPLQPEPAAGPDDARRQGDAGVRVHALPQGRQSHQGDLASGAGREASASLACTSTEA